MATSTFMFREASRSTEFGWSIGPNFDTITRVFYHASAPPNHGWMRLRRQGAKRSMPNHDLSHRRRRPDLDVLEGRWVLSGGVTVIPTLSPPAIVLGINFSPAFPQPATPHFSMAVPASEGFAFWPERPAGFHGGPGSWHGLVPPPGFGGTPALAEFLQGTPVLSISPVDEVAHPALPPFTDPLFPPSMMGSLDASMPRMIQKASSDLEMPRDHGPQMRPLSGIIAENLDTSARDAEGAISQNLKQVALGIQAAVPASAGNTTTPSGQSSPPAGATPVHLTAFLNPEALRSGQSISRGQMSEVSANQKDGSGLGSVTRATSANLVTAATSGPPIGDAVPESDAQASEDKPLTSDDRGGSRLPHAAGLIAKVIPFDRATLEHAVDQFFDQLEDLGVGQLPEPGLPRVLPLTLTVIGSRCRCGDCPTTVTGPGQQRPRRAAAGSHRE